MAKVSELFPSKYLSAADLDGDTTVTIEGVSSAEMKNKQNQTEEKPVLILKDFKPVVLNLTNAKTIAAMYGDDTDNWEGRQIVLYVAEVDAFGETKEAIRVRSKEWMAKRAVKAAQPVKANGNGAAPALSDQARWNSFCAERRYTGKQVNDALGGNVSAWMQRTGKTIDDAMQTVDQSVRGPQWTAEEIPF